MSGYTHHELEVLADQYNLLRTRAVGHGRSCPECFGQGSCWLSDLLTFELESIADSLGYDDSLNESPSEIRDADYEDLVNTYITTKAESFLERNTWGEINAENYDPEASNWLYSFDGQLAVKDTTPYEAEREATEIQDLTTESLWEAVQIWGPYDHKLTDLNLQALARIWRPKSGDIGIYKTFIKSFLQTAIGESGTGFSFSAFCSVCKVSHNFVSSSRNELRSQILSTIRHAHSHLPNSDLRFGANGEVYIEGTNALDPSTMSENRENNISWLIKSADYTLTQLRGKFHSNTITSKEIELGKAWSSFRTQLTK